jgi:uncharacterized protein YmfQ (DUF2313 family)
MKTPIYSSADYLGALQSLLPPGRAWPRELSSILARSMAGLAPVYARNHARAANLLTDAFPATTVELLPEWESTLGLPDSTLGMADTTQGRRAQVVARLTAIGGQSSAYYTQLAAKLGFSISITNYAPFRCGQSRAGQPVGGVEWFFTWSVNASANTVIRFSAGQSGAGEPLGSWGSAVLQSQLAAVAPGHAILQFRYT